MPRLPFFSSEIRSDCSILLFHLGNPHYTTAECDAIKCNNMIWMSLFLVSLFNTDYLSIHDPTQPYVSYNSAMRSSYTPTSSCTLHNSWRLSTPAHVPSSLLHSFLWRRFVSSVTAAPSICHPAFFKTYHDFFYSDTEESILSFSHLVYYLNFVILGGSNVRTYGLHQCIKTQYCMFFLLSFFHSFLHNEMKYWCVLNLNITNHTHLLNFAQQ